MNISYVLQCKVSQFGLSVLFWQSASVICTTPFPSVYCERSGLSARVPRASSWGKRAVKRAAKAALSCSTVSTSRSHSHVEAYYRTFPELPTVRTRDVVNHFGTPWYLFCIFSLSPHHSGLRGPDGCCHPVPVVPVQPIPFSGVSTAAHYWPSIRDYSSSSLPHNSA